MAMTDEHRKRLTRNRVALIKDIQIDEDLLSHLLSTDIITEDMKERIDMSTKTRTEKVGLLLQIIPTRGDNAFRELIAALVNTRQEHIAELLDPDLTQHFKYLRDGDHSEDTADTGAAAAAMVEKSVDEKVSEIRGSADIVAKVISVSSTDRRSKLQKHDEVYKVTGSERGRAVIISNEYFTDGKLKTRYGTAADVMNLKKLLSLLHFTVETVIDKTDEEIYKFLDRERNHAEHITADMFVMFLLSHGEDGHVYALNGEKISIQKIMNYFDGKQCPALLGKPKLFFVQACQGAGTTKGYPKQVSESDGTVSDAAGEPAAGGVDHVDASIHSSPSSDSLSIDIPNHHEKADMLIARSTVSGYVATRHVDFGSQYIRCLVYVFSRKAHVDHVLDMLTEVNHIMSQFSNDGDDVQISDKRDTLTKKVYFMP